MDIKLAYGRNGLNISLPDERTTVIEPGYVPGLPDQEGALRTAVRDPVGSRPLRQMVSPEQTVAISVCDITRPMPSSLVLPIVLRELSHMPNDQITILIATGTHRGNTEEELAQMLGQDVVDNYNVVNHDAFDSSNLALKGHTSGGIPIWLNRHWSDADIGITTGFVEPHFFAGFSGGPKMVAPGLAGFDTIMPLHNSDMIGRPEARWGIIEGNPIHDAIREISEITGVDFAVEVTINRDHRVTSAYAGDPKTVHRAATRFARTMAMQPVDAPFEIVVTTNSGYPLDLNLYQAVKGMSAAAQVVIPGGTIICAAECSDGVPEHGRYNEILMSAATPAELLTMINAKGYDRHDQWQVQIQAQIQMNADVQLKSEYLTHEQIRAAHLT
ncbi:MAG: nickel-dependent lactate racemase, partial [SAR202 cluster bacterium]|nr:nickel-dependent lactate racemase [SAR202 cluster bacterium]